MRDELPAVAKHAQGVDGAFVYLFALNNYTHRPDDPSRDLDMAGPGIVKVFEDLSWQPKSAFVAVAEVYARIQPLGAAGERRPDLRAS